MLEYLPKLALLVVPIGFMFLNGKRGGDEISKRTFGILITVMLFTCFFVASRFNLNSLSYAACFSLFAFWWSVWGWGRYFVVGTGEFYIWNSQKDDPVVDFISDIVFGRNLTTQKEAKRAGLFAMSLRAWSLYLAFPVISILSNSPYPAIIGFAVFLQGICYCLASEVYIDFIRPAERITGFLHGLIIGITGLIIL